LLRILFNLYSEYLTKDAFEGFGVFKLGGQAFCSVKCADDLVQLTEEETVLQGTIDKLTVTGRCYGIEINEEKSKVKRISRQIYPLKIMTEQRKQDNVEFFNYLGSMITNDARCRREIQDCRSKSSIQHDGDYFRQQTGLKFKE
jgi:hypothetical protein